MRVLLIAGLMLLGTFARGYALSESDRSAIESVIEQQLDAFQRDDATTAYGFAAPKLQLLFQGSDRFMGMIRNGYPPIYRPKAHSFGELKESDGTPLLSMRVEDSAGELWTAVYAMEKQPDGTWKIAGCWLVKTPTEGA